MLPAPLPYNKESTKIKVNLCPLTESRLLTSRFIRCCALFTEHVQATAAPGHSVEDSKALDCKIEAIGSEGPLAIEEQHRQNSRAESREEDFSTRGIIAKSGDDASKQQVATVALVQQAAAEPAGEHAVGKSMDEPAEPDEHRSGSGAAEDNGDDKPGQQGAAQNHDNDMDGQQEAAQDGEAAQQQDTEQKNDAGEEEEHDDDEDLYSSRPPAQPHDDNVSTQQGADADGRSSAVAADDKSKKSVELVVVENPAGPDDAKEVVEHDDAKSKKSVEGCALPAGDLALQRVDMVGSPTTKTKMQNFFRVLVAPKALVKGHQSHRL